MFESPQAQQAETPIEAAEVSLHHPPSMVSAYLGELLSRMGLVKGEGGQVRGSGSRAEIPRNPLLRTP